MWGVLHSLVYNGFIADLQIAVFLKISNCLLSVPRFRRFIYLWRL